METPTNKDPYQLLKENIKKFIDSYKNLSPAGKTQFEQQLMLQIKKEDERTKTLYMALLNATKKDLSIEKIIEEMEKADRQFKHGV